MEKKKNALSSFKTKLLIGMVVCIVLMLGTVQWLSSHWSSAYNSAQEVMSGNVGSKVVLDGDTLTIVDYKVFGNTYILSNNTQVSAEFVEKNKIVE